MAQTISIKVNAELFREIHIRAAEHGKSIQDYVSGLICRDLFPESFPQWTEDQTEELRAALETAGSALQCVTDILEGRHSPQQGGLSQL